MLDKLSVFFANILPSQERGRKSLKHRGEKCLNCEQKLDKSDRFCPNCSQLNSTKKLHFKDIFSEFFGSLFAYDSRIMLTLRSLIFRPGFITKEYVAGRRMKYANPFRFYLSVSIIFFLLSGLIDKINDYTRFQEIDNQIVTVRINETPPVDEESNITTEDQAMTDSIHKTNSLATQQSTDSNYKADKEVNYPSESELSKLNRVRRFDRRLKTYGAFYAENKDLKIHEALHQLGHHNNTANRWLYKKAIDLNFFIENPEVAYSYFVSKIPIVIFLFMPVFALFIKLIYIRRNKYTYMEHLVFAFHVQSLLFVLLIFSKLLSFTFSTTLLYTLVFFIFCLYLYKAMRRFYEQGRIKTFVKFMILNSLFTILASFAAIGYLLLSFSVY